MKIGVIFRYRLAECFMRNMLQADLTITRGIAGEAFGLRIVDKKPPFWLANGGFFMAYKDQVYCRVRLR